LRFERALNILGLADYRILAIDEGEHDFHIQAECCTSPSCCAHCGHCKLYRHEVKQQLYLDQPIRGKHVGIIVHRKRYRCYDCRRTFFEPVPQMDEHHFMTERLVHYVQSEALRRTFTGIADDVGVDEKLIRILFSEFAKSLSPRYPSTAVHYLGIDELYLLNQYRCVITDVEHHRIVELLRDRTKASVINYLSHWPKELQAQITAVCTDMWAPYHDAVLTVLPNASLVVDKFHVLKLLSGCLETVRKSVRAGLTDRQRRTLMHDKYLLLRRPYDLSERDTLILEAWLKNFPCLETAYRLKESFYDIYEAQSEDEALARYFAWFREITPDVRDAFLPFTLTIERYGDAIFRYFTHRFTAGYTESLNGLMKLLSREGRGFSFEVIRAKVLLTNGLRKAPRPGYDKAWEAHGAAETQPPLTVTSLTQPSITQ
jgi:transposase